MSDQQIQAMLKHWKVSEQQLMVESIRTHIKFMDAICHRHQLWIKDADDAETAELIHGIVDLLQQAKQKYQQLLEIHEKLQE